MKKQIQALLLPFYAATVTLSSLPPSVVFAQAPSEAQAQRRADILRDLFAKVQKPYKGPFGTNIYQTASGRVSVQNEYKVLVPVPRGRIFTAAYRTADAEALAREGFFVGNLFTTNYAYLNNKYLSKAGAADKGLALDQAKFLASSQIAAEARHIARHMIIERFFVEKYPNSKIASGMRQRGVSDAENETQFYGYFVEFLGKHAANNSDYQNVFEIQRRFNLSGDSTQVNLDKVRADVASIYMQMAPEGESSKSETSRAFLAIRNSIHNYMTPSIQGQIDQFLSKYKTKVSSSILTQIKSLRSAIALYYKTDKTLLVNMATPIAAQMPQGTLNALSTLNEKGNSVQQIETLSRLVAATRDAYMVNRKPALLHWIIRANAYIQAELAGRSIGNDALTRSRIAIDSVYASGLIDRTIWTALRTSFAAQVNSSSTVRARINDLSNLFVTAHTNTSEMLASALQDWKTIDLATEGVLDDTLRGSMLTELNEINTQLTATLPKSDTKYSIENDGTAYGYLVYVPKGSTSADIAQLTKTSIPVFAELPLDLGVVAAIITEQPQTPLSHVSIKSKSRGTPNMYFPNASQDPTFKALLERKALVKVTFKAGQMQVAEANPAEAKAAWSNTQAPAKVQIRADLNERRIFFTSELHSKDLIKVGAKAANYGEAQQALPEGFQEGFGIPFAYYNDFISNNMFDSQRTIKQALADLINDPRAKTDRNFIVDGLAAIQKRMTDDDMIVDQNLVQQLTTLTNQLYPGKPMRFRSSTNSEDLPNFSGAGLYDSYTYDPKKPKKSIPTVLKRTWASVHNIRAYDERELFGIPHLDVYMAMLVSPSFKDELANGVAVTRNIINQTDGAGLYINTQLGEEAVTNPSPDVVPEELLILKKEDPSKRSSLTLKYLRNSTLHPEGPILTDDEATTLGHYLITIHDHFKKVMDPQNKNPKFAIDAEFKLADRYGKRVIFVKQARPYIGN